MFKFYYRSSVRQPVETCQCQMSIVLSNSFPQENNPTAVTNLQDENIHMEVTNLQDENIHMEVTNPQDEKNYTEVTEGPIMLSSFPPKKKQSNEKSCRQYIIRKRMRNPRRRKKLPIQCSSNEFIIIKMFKHQFFSFHRKTLDITDVFFKTSNHRMFN